jgi:hypothetical protein
MQKRLWKLYTFTFIKTPIAALFIIVGLAVGMYVLMNSIRIQSYWAVTGAPEEKGESTLITVQGNNHYAELHMRDKITWYIEESGERYEGTVLKIDSSTEANRLEIEVTAADWTRAKKEADVESAVPPVYVELPQGQKTVFAKLFKKGAVE